MTNKNENYCECGHDLDYHGPEFKTGIFRCYQPVGRGRCSCKKFKVKIEKDLK